MDQDPGHLLKGRRDCCVSVHGTAVFRLKPADNYGGARTLGDPFLGENGEKSENYKNVGQWDKTHNIQWTQRDSLSHLLSHFKSSWDNFVELLSFMNKVRKRQNGTDGHATFCKRMR